MGCTVRSKHVRPNRKTRSTKPQFDPSCLLNKTALSTLLDSNPSGNFEDNGYGYCTEEQLEDLLLKHLEHIYNEAVSKLVSLGYDDDVALRAVLSNGYCYGGTDVLNNILDNSLAHLKGSSNGEEDEDGSEPVFADLRQLVEYSLAVSFMSVRRVRLIYQPLERWMVIDCPRRFNLTPSMKCLLRENVAAFAAGYRASKKCEQPPQESVSSVLEKFQDLNLDDDSAPEKGKDDALIGLLRQVQDLKRQVEERREWAQKKAMQAAQKVSDELSELQSLRSVRDENLRLKKGKQSGEDSTVKRISEMESDLRKVSSHVDKAGMIARRLENENAVIRAEIEASKLSESESLTACIEATKKEKKRLKRLVAWEKQKKKLQEEIDGEKEKIKALESGLAQIIHEGKEYEEKWREEQEAKEQALAQVEEEQRSKEATEVRNKRNVESLRLKIEIDFQRHKDDLQRLEQELSRLNKDSSTDASLQSNNISQTKGEVVFKLLEELERLDGLYEKEESYDRECLICMKEEVSVVFLPCAHQVVCASCSDSFMGGDKATCPCCRASVQERIRVFGATS
ncbi:BnaA05g08670D [Brassica napus]|uniref:BnaA05g08670D protein n=1 Tax=Brassica napus TaxID=3708 RepID=A0A078GYZ8_BRANA|nr:BnaA05g08670D [Brassica napus]